jgi:hypothetical protein
MHVLLFCVLRKRFSGLSNIIIYSKFQLKLWLGVPMNDVDCPKISVAKASKIGFFPPVVMCGLDHQLIWKICLQTRAPP